MFSLQLKFVTNIEHNLKEHMGLLTFLFHTDEVSGKGL